MSLTIIKLTEFQVEKLHCMGGAKSSNPYRITVFDGIDLGIAGSVGDTTLEAANHDSFELRAPMGFKRLLTMFGM